MNSSSSRVLRLLASHRHLSGSTSNSLSARTSLIEMHTRITSRHQPSSFFHASSRICEETQTDKAGEEEEEPKKLPKPYHSTLKEIREEYKQRMAAYRQEVHKLRIEYAKEVARNKAEDAGDEERVKSQARRQKLERQRLKNIRTGQTMIRQEQLRLQQAEKFQQHLAQEKIKREKRMDDYRAAQQLAIEEMEKDAVHWLSTPEEIEQAFTHEAEQLLWGQQGGYVGSPNPSPDTQFWQNETHTWHMNKTYKEPKDYLLQQLEEYYYNRANLDPAVWTPERLLERERKRDKARLRADVQLVGKRSLLRRQQQMIEEMFTEDNDDGKPKEKPPTNLSFLSDKTALEKEGSEILMKDPTRFFEFDASRQSEEASSEESAQEDTTEEYSGQTLGNPVGLKRIGKNNFPIIMGQEPPEDKRSEREKKAEERELRLLQAAKEKEAAEMGSIDIAASDDVEGDFTPDMDYNDYDYLNVSGRIERMSEEEKQELTPADVEAMRNSYEGVYHYTNEDWEWALEQLKEQEEFYASQLRLDVEDTCTQMRGKLEDHRRKEAQARGEDYELPSQVDPNDLEHVVFSMSSEQALALSDLDEKYEEDPASVTDEDMEETAKKVEVLTLEQLSTILKRDRTSLM